MWIFCQCHSLEGCKNFRLWCPEVKALPKPKSKNRPGKFWISGAISQPVSWLQINSSYYLLSRKFPDMKSYGVLVSSDLWCISPCSICFSNSRESLALQRLETVFKSPRQSVAHISLFSLRVKFNYSTHCSEIPQCWGSCQILFKCQEASHPIAFVDILESWSEAMYLGIDSVLGLNQHQLLLLHITQYIALLQVLCQGINQWQWRINYMSNLYKEGV